MAVDQQALDRIRRSLHAEDYHLQVIMHGESAEVVIAAGPAACADCLVSKDLMRVMLAPALGVPPEHIDLAYPAEMT